MQLIKTNTFCAVFCGAVMASTSLWATPDPNEVANRLVEFLASDDSEASFKAATYSDRTDTISIIGFQMKEKRGDGVTDIQSINIKGYDESNTAGLSAESVTAAGIKITDSGTMITIASANVTDFVLPTFDINWNDPASWQIKFDGLAVSSASVLDPDIGQPITISSITSKTYYSDNADAFDSGQFNMRGLTIPTAIMDPPAQAFMQSAGYSDLVLDGRLDFRYDADKQELTYQSLSISAKDMGSLNMSFKFGNFPAEYVMGPVSEGDIEKLLPQLTFHNASVQFTNQSIFEKALAFIAQAQGQNADALKQQIVAFASIRLAPVNDPGFTKAVTDALSQFVQDPKSLRIQASPRQPIPFLEILGLAQGDPKSLIETLRIKIKAN